jgi:hypothetical protein
MLKQFTSIKTITVKQAIVKKIMTITLPNCGMELVSAVKSLTK